MLKVAARAPFSMGVSGVSDFEGVLRQAMADAATGDTRAHRSFERSLRSFEEALADAPGARERRGRPGERPGWASELGVDLPCTVEDVKRAFRRRAFETHPDRRGGSHQAFLRVQGLLHEALESLRSAGRGARPATLRYVATAAAGADDSRLPSTYA